MILRRQRFVETRREVSSSEQHELQERYDVLDAMVKLNFDALRLRQGKICDFPTQGQVSTVKKTYDLIKTSSTQSNNCCGHEAETLSAQADSVKRSMSVPRLPKISSSPSSSSSLRIPCKPHKRSGTAAQISYRKNGGGQEDYEASQLQALNVLVTSVDTGKPLTELLRSVSRHILTHLGNRAFPVEQLELAIASALEKKGLAQEPSLEEAAQERVDLVVDALRSMSLKSVMPFTDVIGQVLWRNRRSEVLQKRKFKDTAEDLCWLMPRSTDDQGRQSEQLQVVDDVFDMLCGENGRMTSRGWHQVVRIVGRSPALSGRVSLSDVDRLWYAQTRSSSSKEILRDIDLHGFKALLLALGESMRVHPWMVFLGVASHAYNSKTSSRCSTPSTVTPQSSSRGSPTAYSKPSIA